MAIRDRIKEFRRVKASDLQPHPKNYREHPSQQRAYLDGILAEVGYAGAVIARELPDGKLQLIDGHMRQEEAGPDQLIPTLIVDVTEEEAEKLLLTFDPISAMALENEAALKGLTAGVEFQDAELRKLLAEMESTLPADVVAEGPQGEEAKPPAMELQPHEHYDYVLVLARNTFDWNYLIEKLGLDRVNSSVVPGQKKYGLGRAIDARRLIDLLEKANGSPLRPGDTEQTKSGEGATDGGLAP